MNKYIIALGGKTDAGKTSTLLEVFRIITERTGVEIVSIVVLSEEDPDSDIESIFKYRGLLFGFCSGGDDVGYIKLRLEEYSACDLIICASRTSRATKEEIMKYESTHIISWIRKWESILEENQNAENRAMALHLIEIFDNCVNALVEQMEDATPVA